MLLNFKQKFTHFQEVIIIKNSGIYQRSNFKAIKKISDTIFQENDSIKFPK